MISLFKVIDTVKSGLDATALRHKLISNNIANVNTPQFRRSDVDFSVYLSNESNRLPVSTTHRNHLSMNQTSNSSNHFAIQKEQGTIMGNDLNNVDIDREMTLILENQLHYLAMTDIINRNLGFLRSAISEGRK